MDELYYYDLYKKHFTEGIDFSRELVLNYLTLKSNGLNKTQIIEKLDLRCTYIEQRLRLYILEEMNCKTINQAVLKAYKLGWIK